MVKFKVLTPCWELTRVGVTKETIHQGDLINGKINFQTQLYGITHFCKVYKGNYQLIDETKTIEIQHQETKAFHQFNVANPDSLTREEVLLICEEMGVKALLINGKYYDKK